MSFAISAFPLGGLPPGWRRWRRSLGLAGGLLAAAARAQNGPAPSILTQPASQTVSLGKPAILTVATDDVGDTYQRPFDVTPSVTTLDTVSDGSADGMGPTGLIQGQDGRLYGLTSSGGVDGYGTLFAVDTDGTNLTTLYNFTGNYYAGGPQGGLLQGSDGRLYGATGGLLGDNGATLFAVDTDGTGFTTLFAFSNAQPGQPVGNLIQGSDGRLYGTAAGGGANGYGQVFTVDTDGTGFTTLYSFTSDPGTLSGVTQGNDGRLYGTTSATNGVLGLGTVFALNTDGTGFTTLYNFSGGADGSFPLGGLIQGSDGRLYGTTTVGGAFNDGVIFAVAADGTGFTVIYSFGSSGVNPTAGVVQGRDGRLYGTTPPLFEVILGLGQPPSPPGGTLYAVNPDGTGFTTLYQFAGGTGPLGGIVQGSDLKLYGVAGVIPSPDWSVFAFTLPFALQPASQTVAAGGTVVLEAAANGTGAAYQWQLNGVDLTDGPDGGATLAGATGPELVIIGATAALAGTYTVVVSDSLGDATSLPAALAVTPSAGPPVLANLSTRAYVGPGTQEMIGGFILGGATARTVLIQAVGPGLAGAVGGNLPATSIALYDSNGPVASDTGWKTGGNGAALLAAASAVDANANLADEDSALLVTLPPGAYTVVVSGSDGATGIAVLGIYQMP